VAHRGASFSHPENTAAAFDAALGNGTDGIELDVQLTLDEIPVVFHDKTVSKIGYGRKHISELRFEELRKLDMGSWFGKAFKGEQILTLDEVLKKYAHKTHLFLEIKTRQKRGNWKRRLKLAEVIVQAVIDQKLEKKTFILSFDRKALQAAQTKAPHLKYVLNLGVIPRILTPVRKSLLSSFYGVGINVRVLTRKFVKSVHQFEKSVLVYTCNSSQTVNRAAGAGVDAIISDKPAWVASYLHKNRG